MAMEICERSYNCPRIFLTYPASDAQSVARASQENEGKQGINVPEGKAINRLRTHMVLSIHFRAPVGFRCHFLTTASDIVQDVIRNRQAIHTQRRREHMELSAAFAAPARY